MHHPRRGGSRNDDHLATAWTLSGLVGGGNRRTGHLAAYCGSLTVIASLDSARDPLEQLPVGAVVVLDDHRVAPRHVEILKEERCQFGMLHGEKGLTDAWHGAPMRPEQDLFAVDDDELEKGRKSGLRRQVVVRERVVRRVYLKVPPGTLDSQGILKRHDLPVDDAIRLPG